MEGIVKRDSSMYLSLIGAMAYRELRERHWGRRLGHRGSLLSESSSLMAEQRTGDLDFFLELFSARGDRRSSVQFSIASIVRVPTFGLFSFFDSSSLFILCLVIFSPAY